MYISTQPLLQALKRVDVLVFYRLRLGVTALRLMTWEYFCDQFVGTVCYLRVKDLH